MQPIKKIAPPPAGERYETLCASFSWARERQELTGMSPQRGMNIANLAVDQHADGELRNQIALRWILKDFSVKELTYAELKNETSKFSRVLESLEVTKGEAVFTLLGRIPELYLAALGTLKIRAIFCPLFSVFGPEPIFQRLMRGDAKVLVTTSLFYKKKIEPILGRLPSLKFVLLTDISEDLNEKVRSLPQLMENAWPEFEIPYTDPEDPALLHFTSGTTGMPKGALHVHNAVLMHYVTGKYVLDFHKGDIFWCTADPGWVTGTSYGILAPLVNGICNIIDEEEFDATRWYRILQDQKVNIWYTAPTAIRRLMRMDIRPLEQYDLKNLRLILSVGEPLHAGAVKWGEEMLGIPIRDNWWQTETGGIMIANFPFTPVRPGSMGRPLPGIEAAIAQTEPHFHLVDQPGTQGHLVLKKGWPSMFRSYLHDDERYQKCFHDTWYITGDLAKADEDGYFWFVGRADDIIKSSGHMVGPFEVESTLMQHPAVAEAAVIGKPDPLIGELVKAFIVLKPGFAAAEDLAQDITGFARTKLGAAVAPKELVFIAELPKTKSGKILRRLLKARELGLPEGDLSTLEQP